MVGMPRISCFSRSAEPCTIICVMPNVLLTMLITMITVLSMMLMMLTIKLIV